MIQGVHRANPFLNEALEMLDQHLYRCDNDVKKAFAYLGPTEKDFIDGEILSCINDPRYYLENYHVIQTEDQGLRCLTPFWESQELFYFEIVKIWKEGKPVKILVLKARQQGISEFGAGLVFHKTIFTETCNSVVIAHDISQSDFLFSKCRLSYDSLPWWMRPEERYQAKGRYLVFDKKDDIERQLSPGLRSQVLVENASKVSGSPLRGKTIRAALFSEASSWPDGGILAKSIFPTMNASDELAIMESTALGRQGFFYRFWKEVEKGAHEDWTACFIPVYRTLKKYSLPIKPGVVFITTPEEEAIKKKVLQADAVELPNEFFNWRRAIVRKFIDLTGSEFDTYGEYPINSTEAFQGTGICAFPRKLLHKLMERECQPPRWYGEIYYEPTGTNAATKYKLHLKEVAQGEKVPEQEGHGTRFHVWEKPDPDYSYYIGGDIAAGDTGSGDYSCLEVIKIGKGVEVDEQVAEWHGYENPTPLGAICAALGYWYNSAQIAIECNGVGIATNNHLFRILEYENIYRWKHIDRIKHFITDALGWWTNAKTRDVIITKMREAIMERTLVLRSYRLVDQMLDFSKEEGASRYEGQDAPDDRVFGAMIANYCGHESDFGKDAAAQPRRHRQDVECWYVYDPLGRMISPPEQRQVKTIDGQPKEFMVKKDGWDYEDAMMLIHSKAGWSMRPKIEKNKVTWIIWDSEGKKVDELDDYDLARQMALKNKWSVRQSVSRVDYQNSDYSPIYDRKGPEQRLHEAGIPAEQIRGEVLLHAQIAGGNPVDAENGDDAWKEW